jgi:hypothetical protein
MAFQLAAARHSRTGVLCASRPALVGLPGHRHFSALVA